VRCDTTRVSCMPASHYSHHRLGINNEIQRHDPHLSSSSSRHITARAAVSRTPRHANNEREIWVPDKIALISVNRESASSSSVRIRASLQSNLVVRVQHSVGCVCLRLDDNFRGNLWPKYLTSWPSLSQSRRSWSEIEGGIGFGLIRKYSEVDKHFQHYG